MENSGSFSLIEYQGGVTGLSLVPTWDKEFWESENVKNDLFACNSCGNVKHSNQRPDDSCPRCKQKDWVRAVECKP